MIADKNNFQVTAEIPEALNRATIKQLETYFEQNAKYGQIKMDQKTRPDGLSKLRFTGYESKQAKQFLMPKINDLIQRAIPDDWTGVIKQLYDKQSNKFVLTDV